jgi:ZIP family zinc transporter
VSAVAEFFASLPLVYAGMVASLLAGLAAGVGALPVLLISKASQRLQDVLLGTAAGIMLAAASFSLLIPALDAGAEQFGGLMAGGAVAAFGLMLGAGAIWFAHKNLPHEHFFQGQEGVQGRQVRRIWLFIFAITLHNIPEGLAVGVGFGGGNVANGLALTVGIFLQNLPEGFVVALALLGLNYARLTAVAVALATGAVETVGGFIGAGFVSLSQALLPLGLAGAAGAMLFVISHEIIPETHGNGHQSQATFGLVTGFAIMMVLDVVTAGLI